MSGSEEGTESDEAGAENAEEKLGGGPSDYGDERVCAGQSPPSFDILG